MQKYYCMVKYGTVYSEKETKHIYRYVHYRNLQNERKYQQEIDKGYTGEEYLDKIVPEDIFHKYSFLFKDNNLDSVNDETSDWGESDSLEIDFTVEEMLDMPILGDEIIEQYNIADNKTHGINNHELFCVAEKGLN